MMGTAVDIRQSLDQMHDEKAKEICEQIAERLVAAEDFETLELFNSVVLGYEKLSRTNFGLKSKLRNREFQEYSRRFGND